MLVIKGVASWAKVFEPDTKFDANGVYSINVSVPEAEAAHVCEQLDEIAAQQANKIVKEQPKVKASLSTRQPYETEYDDDGNETGNVLFKAKMKAGGTTRDGRSYTQKPMVVDSKRTPMTEATLIGNGSVVKVAVEPAPYYVAAQKQAGVSLRLKAVQVIDLVEYGGNANSFFDEEDGYVANAVQKDNKIDEVFDDGFSPANDEGDF